MYLRRTTHRRCGILAATLSAAAFLILGLAAHAQTAQARLYCLSLRFQQGTEEMGFFTLDLTTLDSFSWPNGELAPTYDQPSHFSGFQLYDVIWETIVEGWMDLNVPMSRDDNGNGFADFFEVSQGVSGTTSGAFGIPNVESGTVRATWSRAAGAKDGTCVIQLTGSSGSYPAFTHVFELLEYTGPLRYTPGTNRITGTVDVRQTGATENRFVGSVEFLKSGGDPHNTLALEAGGWTNAWGDAYTYLSSDSYQRDTLRRTNYYGFVWFDPDGDLGSAEPDYYDWGLSVDDLNDADGDSIPDFSDEPGGAPPRRPTVSLSVAANSIALSIGGTVGRVHEIQQATSLAAKDWATVQTVTLGSDPQTVTLSRPGAGLGFWRVRVL